MKSISLFAAALFLSGCANSIELINTENGARSGHGEITVSWYSGSGMQVSLDGTIFAGTWSDIDCHQDICWQTSRNAVTFHDRGGHRRHTRHGIANLRSADGNRLRCEFELHRGVAAGVCRTPENKSFDLIAEKNSAPT